MHALLEGEQILDVRKGGIREDGRHFAVQATRIWLYPTLEHQRPELLKTAYSRWVESEPPADGPGDFEIAGWADVVKINNFLVDIAANMAAFREVRDTFLNRRAPPASTTIGVPALARPGGLFEIEAIAVAD